jgi:hypothetical protein
MHTRFLSTEKRNTSGAVSLFLGGLTPMRILYAGDGNVFRYFTDGVTEKLTVFDLKLFILLTSSTIIEVLYYEFGNNFSVHV